MRNNLKNTIIRIIITAILVVILLLALFITVVNWVNENKVTLKFPVEVKTNKVITISKREAYVSPLGTEILAKEPVVKKLEPDFSNPVEKEIYEVFGKEHFDKVMLLLTGKDCAENRTLNPKAINVNKDKRGNVLSKDFGVFQINNFWQGVTNPDFLLDPAINIRMAYRIYQDNNFSFKLWTCGKVLGI